MTSDKDQKPSGGLFGGIRNAFLNAVTTEEYREQIAEKQGSSEGPVAQSQKTEPLSATPNGRPFTSPEDSADAEKIAHKMFSFVEKLNQDGIDFFELWNAVEEIGGVNPQNIQVVYKTLFAASGKTLTVEKIISTGNYYIDELQKQITTDLGRKQKEKENLLTEQTTEKSRLNSEVEDLKIRIVNLQNELTEKQQSLNQIDGRYSLRVVAVEKQIQAGTAGLNKMLMTMQGIIGEVQKIKQ